MIRLFIALIIPDEIKSEILKHCYAAADNPSDYRWEDRDKIHLTLKFIGEVKEELLPEIINELEFVKSYSSFNCEVSRFGFFFRDNQPKILWCNLDTDESIISLADELNKRLSKFDIEAEKRKFKGHLTLLRIKERANEDFIKRFKEYKFNLIKFNSNKIALIQSILRTNGSEYKVLKIYELK
jgi:2'-5' RNA ligase